MGPVRRVVQLGSLVLLGFALSGCVVVPLGGWHGRGGRHHLGSHDVRPGTPEGPREPPRQRGW